MLDAVFQLRGGDSGRDGGLKCKFVGGALYGRAPKGTPSDVDTRYAFALKGKGSSDVDTRLFRLVVNKVQADAVRDLRCWQTQMR